MLEVSVVINEIAQRKGNNVLSQRPPIGRGYYVNGGWLTFKAARLSPPREGESGAAALLRPVPHNPSSSPQAAQVIHRHTTRRV